MEIVRCLLRSRTDYITVRNVEWSMPSPDPGWTKCPDCKVNKRHPPYFCFVCNDTGYKRRTSESEVEYDRYCDKAVSSVEDGSSDPPRVRLERDEDQVDRNLRQRDARNQNGSLDKLERALHDLHSGLRRVLVLVYDGGLLGLPNAREEQAVRLLAETIPGRLEPPPWHRREIRELKIKKIREVAATGLKISEIAKAVGCGQRLVSQVLAKETA